ncbi:hypothetical protein AU14_17300 [Marinobacter similis]|uniref:DUF4402 domain-containing protein n=2 Tax=Marinobacter similis TaxID=1420916 RepID=W5YMB9_9GAMM|nr:hypothetical protein AU14_17300 [Marinobacter similis]
MRYKKIDSVDVGYFMKDHLNFKKITLSAGLASCLLAPHSVLAADDSATASANVIAPIQITKTADLVFGDFAPGVGGTVTVSTSGARTATGPILSASGASSSAAQFDVVGEANATYSISYSGDTALTNTTGGGGETMLLTRHSDLTGAGAIAGEVTSGTLGITGTQSIYLGGTLAVSGTQVPGSYQGTVTVTVEYN